MLVNDINGELMSVVKLSEAIRILLNFDRDGYVPHVDLFNKRICVERWPSYKIGSSRYIPLNLVLDFKDNFKMKIAYGDYTKYGPPIIVNGTEYKIS